MHRKLFAVLLCLTVIAIAALIIVSHFQNVYRFNCIYSVTLLYGEPENVSISNFRLIVPYPLFTRMKLHAASPLQVWYQIVSTPYGKSDNSHKNRPNPTGTTFSKELMA